MTIAQTVSAALEGATESHLENIAAHGIHNLTNDYSVGTAVEYEAFAAEFERQAIEVLASIESARMAAIRAA